MGQCGSLRCYRSTRLQDDNGFAALSREIGHAVEARKVAEAFDMQADGRDTLIGKEVHGDGRHGLLCLIACSNKIGDGQTAPLHREVEEDI